MRRRVLTRRLANSRERSRVVSRAFETWALYTMSHTTVGCLKMGTSELRREMSDNLSAEAEAERDAFKRRLRLACIWSWPVCVVTFFAFFAVVAGFIPPPDPSWTAKEFAQF